MSATRSTSSKCESIRRRQPRPRRAFAVVLAMLYLMLFTVLAVGFCAATAISVQVANNEKSANDAQAAAESGMEFVKYQLDRIEMPPSADPLTDGGEIALLAAILAKQLDGSADMKGHSVRAAEQIIYLPANDDFIGLDPSGYARFQARIALRGAALSVTVVGYGASPSIARTIRMDFRKQPPAGPVIRFFAAPETYEEGTP